MHLNIEAKVHPGRPTETASPPHFVECLTRAVSDSGVADRVMISSFDWRILKLVGRSMPGLRLGALVTESGFLTGVADHWTGGIDVRARPFRGDHAAAAASLGATALCVNWQACTEAAIRSAHQAELLLLAWTVNSKATMRRLIDRGVDGIVTDFPDRLREVMTEKGMPLPCPAPVKPCKAPAA